MAKRKRQIIRDNKMALYVHLSKKRIYIYLPENTIIEKDKEGYIIKINEKLK